MVISVLLCILLAYLIGSINPAHLIGRLNGADIRELGSGNAGASNVVIHYGKLAGLFAALCDVFKATFAVHLCIRLFPLLTFAREIAGVCVILGHIFPWYLHFRGGKGLACLGGVILGNSVKVFVILLILAIVIALVTNYICIVPITMSIAYPVLYVVLTGSIVGGAVYLVMPAVICWKHRENLQRIKDGTEARFSYLWDKDKEMDRLQHNKDAAEGK